MWFGQFPVSLTFMLSLFCKDLDGEKIIGFKINVPVHIKVQSALCVHIPCSFTLNNTLGNLSKGIWLKNDWKGGPVASKAASQVSFDKKGRFIMTGDLKKGDCTLSINDAESGDKAKYNYRVEGDGRLQFSYYDLQPNLTVQALTTKPVIVPIKTMIAGEEVTLICTAPGRCAGTAPTIIWEGSISNITYKTQEEKHLDGNSTFSSKIKLTPYKKDHRTSLTCKVKYKSAGAPITSNTIILNVEYSPSMDINITESNSAIIENETVIMEEGDSLILRCAVDSNPAANIIWMKKDNYIKSIMNEKSLALELCNISFSDADTYLCLAWNSRGNISKTVHISLKGESKRADIDEPNAWETVGIIYIVGSVIGNILVTTVICLGFTCYNRRTRNKKETEVPESSSVGLSNLKKWVHGLKWSYFCDNDYV
ncbi:sialic acid-binding Ig-like lectin 13 [Discoglossus pictus]